MRTGLSIFLTVSLLIFCTWQGSLFFELVEARGSAQDRPSLPDRSYPAPKGEKALLIDVKISEDLVLMVGERGLIFRSEDGGVSFQQVEAPTRRMICSVTWTEKRNAFAVGHDMTVLRSTDSGKSWQQVFRDPEADLALFSVISLAAGRVVAVGSFGTVLISEDQGENWRQELISEDGPHLYSIKSVGSKLVAVGEFGSIFLSDDGGDSWTQSESPYEGTFFDVIPLEASQLLLLGLRGNLWSGQVGDWERVKTDFQASLFGGTRFPDGSVIVVGDEGRVMVRSATGQWLDRSPGERRMLSSAAVLSTDSVLIVGEKGYRVRSISSSDESEGGR